MYHICFIDIYPLNGYRELNSFEVPCLTRVATIKIHMIYFLNIIFTRNKYEKKAYSMVFYLKFDVGTSIRHQLLKPPGNRIDWFYQEILWDGRHNFLYLPFLLF